MKKAVLFALLLAAAMSASAETYSGYAGPNRGAGNLYLCDYQNYPGPAVDPGASYWDLTAGADASGKPILRGIEYFEAWHPTFGNYLENYRVTWAKPAINWDPVSYTYFTRWEFTFKDGPQCKKTDVYFNGVKIVFKDCTDGHSRTCWLQY
jgi:ABC-type transport system substrate-binding protein